MQEFCGEIQYDTTEGMVHSDICWHNADKQITPEYRKFLHECLDEWLDKIHAAPEDNHLNAFWLGDPQYFNNFNSEN